MHSNHYLEVERETLTRMIGMRKLIKAILPTLLVAVMILGVILPTSGQQQPPAPKISLEPPTTTVTVSTHFTLTVWIRSIAQGYSMRWYSYKITWDRKQVELV